LHIFKKADGVEAIRIGDESLIDVAPDGAMHGIDLLNANENCNATTAVNVLSSTKQLEKSVKFRF